MLVVGGTFTACKKNKIVTDAIFITKTNNVDSRILVLDGATASTKITAGASELVSNDVEVRFSVDPGLVDSYSKDTGIGYTLLPVAGYSIPQLSCLIKKGTNISESINVIINSWSGYDPVKTYLLPISIQSVSGDLTMLQNSKTVYLIVRGVINTRAASGTEFNADVSANTKLTKMSVFSVQGRINYESLSPTQAAWASNVFNDSNGGFQLRVTPKRMQFIAGSTLMNSSIDLIENTWYDFALVYDGSSFKFYLNGDLDLSSSASTSLNLSKLVFGASNASLSEIRIWSVALKQSKIRNFKCGVDPRSPGLECYWKMDTSTGKIVTDAAGKGYNLIAKTNIQWLPGVKCQ